MLAHECSPRRSAVPVGLALATLVVTACSTSSPLGAAPPSGPGRTAPGATSAPPVAQPLQPSATGPTATPGRASSPPVEVAPGLGQPACLTNALTVTDADTLYMGEATHELFTIRTSGPDCQLEGYPEVEVLDAGGAALPVSVERGGFNLPGGPPKPVTLSRSTSVSFRIATARRENCPTATAMLVRLPGGGSRLRVSTGMPICDARAGLTPIGRTQLAE